VIEGLETLEHGDDPLVDEPSKHDRVDLNRQDLAVIAVERLIRPDALPALLPARLSGQSGVPQ
ncbi:MAG: hypothetical protein ACPGN4_02040, partial [Miltoncostaeaceae bacterium]